MMDDPPVATSVPVPRPLGVWLAGRTDWASYLRLAERLAWEVSEPQGCGPTLVLCELEPLITIGREGSRSDVLLRDDALRARRLECRFVGRGGGAVVQGPGQLFVALFARIADLGLGPTDVGGYLKRFEAGLAAALRDVMCGPQSLPAGAGPRGIMGRTGLLAALGIAVRRGVACHGAFVNVGTDPTVVQQVCTLPAGRRGGRPVTMGSIEADLQRRVRPQDVRSAVASQLALAFACPGMHIHAGFPPAATGFFRRSTPASRVG
jgi:lipoyl(octanoyl) transferase